jgi:hypothetical protein
MSTRGGRGPLVTAADVAAPPEAWRPATRPPRSPGRPPSKPFLQRCRTARCRDVMRPAKAVVSFPMHAFRLKRKKLENIWVTTQLCPYFLRSLEPALTQRLLLTCVRQPAAASARELLAAAIDHRYSAQTSATSKPRSALAKTACRLDDRYVLFDGFPLRVPAAPYLKHQYNRVGFDARSGAARRRSSTCPGQ